MLNIENVEQCPYFVILKPRKASASWVYSFFGFLSLILIRTCFNYLLVVNLQAWALATSFLFVERKNFVCAFQSQIHYRNTSHIVPTLTLYFFVLDLPLS